MTSTVISTIREHKSFRDPNAADKLRIWLGRSLCQARYVRFERKGATPQDRLPLARLFIDIPASPQPLGGDSGGSGPGVVATLLGIEPASPSLRDVLPDRDTPPRAALAWTGYLLIGGPGQGKSTITQYLGQLHRAAVLAEIENELDEEERATLEELRHGVTEDFAADHSIIRNACIPAHVDLPAMSRWMEHINAPVESAVIEYVRHHIQLLLDDGSQGIPADDLSALFALVPWLFGFDGLDEVTAAEDRARVIQAITAFLGHMRESQTRLLAVATTRPHGYNDELTRNFEPRYLCPLSTKRALEYAAKLLRQRHAGDPDRQRVRMDELKRACGVVLARDPQRKAITAVQHDLPPGIRADQVLTGQWFELVSTRDPETLERLQEHYNHLREGRAATDPERARIERELRARLDDFPGTTMEQLVRQVAAETMAEQYPRLDEAKRRQARERLDELVAKKLGASRG